jgi:hypothetical protein
MKTLIYLAVILYFPLIAIIVSSFFTVAIDALLVYARYGVWAKEKPMATRMYK